MKAHQARPCRRRKHRLSRELYQGEITACFTACVGGRREVFLIADVVGTALGDLRRACEKHRCDVLIYCFMPDHLHAALRGTAPAADLWSAMTLFKQLSGYRLSRRLPGFHWQKGFFDHVLRDESELAKQLRYISENPVRRGLAKSWQLYPFLGSDALDLHAVL